MDKKQFVIKILFAIPTSILAYGVYRLLNYLVFELITYIYWVDIWWKTEHFLYNILIGIFAAYFFAEVLSWFHQKTNDKLVGYLESCFLVWLFIMWGMVSNSQYYLIIIESKVLEICLLIICLAVMVIVSLLRKKNRYCFPKEWKMRNVLIIITLSFWVYSWILLVLYFMIDKLAYVITGILFTFCFVAFHRISKEKYLWKITRVYALAMSVVMIISGIYIYQQLQFHTDTLEKLVRIVLWQNGAYITFGIAMLLGELIAWISHIGREFEKKIIEKRNAQNKEE